ncbi:hypothetical protein [Fusobacterium gonidiaformans]|uniref:hypothetical protein n=1 Tax=Fusobacterium gonidiaformans TaxID=849 RepID=UPI00307E075D
METKEFLENTLAALKKQEKDLLPIEENFVKLEAIRRQIACIEEKIRKLKNFNPFAEKIKKEKNRGMER